MDELQKQARRLRELFHGRYTQDEAMQLLAHYGEHAARCVLQAEPREISRILGNEDNNQRFTQEEYERASRLLEEGLESDSEPRQLACRDCERCWWKKVPGRKKVSTCFRCRQKFEPIPKDKEWGTGQFKCHFCQFEFKAAAIMGVTECVCHKCNHTVPVKSIIPPSKRPDFAPNKDRHDCNGVNCYRRHVCPPECRDCPNDEHDENRRRPRNFRLQDLMEMELRINRLPNYRPYYRGGRRRNFKRQRESPPGGGRPGGPDDDPPDDHSQNYGALFGGGRDILGMQADDNHCNGEFFMLDVTERATSAIEDGVVHNVNAEFGGEALEIKMQVLRLNVRDSSQDGACSVQAEDYHCNGDLMHEVTRRSTSANANGSGQNVNDEVGGEALEVKMQVLRLNVCDSSQNEACSSSVSNSQGNEPENNEKQKKKRHRKKKQRKISKGTDAENNIGEPLGNQASLPNIGEPLGNQASLPNIGEPLGSQASLPNIGEPLGNQASLPNIGEPLGNQASLPNIGEPLGNQASLPNIGELLGNQASLPNIGEPLGNQASLPNIGEPLGNQASLPNIGELLGNQASLPNIGEPLGNQASLPNNQDSDDAVSETGSSSTNDGDYFTDDDPPSPGQEGQPKTPLCHHVRSGVPRGAVVRTWSERHISTGSTVTTCLDQISLRTQSVRLAYKMFGEE